MPNSLAFRAEPLLFEFPEIKILDFLLRNEVFRQQHVCSNLLTPAQAPQTQAGRGFMDGYDAARIPQIPGFDSPHQVAYWLNNSCFYHFLV